MTETRKRSWDCPRKGKRLARIAPNIVCQEPFFEVINVTPLYENSEISSYNETRENLITQHYVPEKNVTYQSKLQQTSEVFSLPEEILMTIFCLLPQSDIITMVALIL